MEAKPHFEYAYRVLVHETTQPAIVLVEVQDIMTEGSATRSRGQSWWMRREDLRRLTWDSLHDYDGGPYTHAFRSMYELVPKGVAVAQSHPLLEGRKLTEVGRVEANIYTPCCGSTGELLSHARSAVPLEDTFYFESRKETRDFWRSRVVLEHLKKHPWVREVKRDSTTLRLVYLFPVEVLERLTDKDEPFGIFDHLPSSTDPVQGEDLLGLATLFKKFSPKASPAGIETCPEKGGETC